ncbi:MAG: hypothetical protein UDG84_03140 [Thomasclavelia sp.]|nr:hypothetical protein [Thomasclavelia sp.]DAJ69583.1 MAG TPA: hypothetical protein [Caudoviricetes sp.]DAW00152.1 MAG TPA: hypothetical protein [Caudoviricetes sp.]
MTGEKMNTLLGMKWDDVSEIDKKELLANAVVNNGITSDPVQNGEDGIVDLIHPLSIAGRLSLDGETIEIDTDAVIYNSEGYSYINNDD